MEFIVPRHHRYHRRPLVIDPSPLRSFKIVMQNEISIFVMAIAAPCCFISLANLPPAPSRAGSLDIGWAGWVRGCAHLAFRWPSRDGCSGSRWDQAWSWAARRCLSATHAALWRWCFASTGSFGRSGCRACHPTRFWLVGTSWLGHSCSRYASGSGSPCALGSSWSGCCVRTML